MGFLFLVLYPPPPSARRPPVLLLTHTHSHTHSLTNTHSLTLTHTLTHSPSLTHSLTHSPHTHSHTHSLTHSHSLTLTHALTHSLTHTHTHTHTHSLTHSLTHSHTHSLTHSLTRTHSHTLTHSLTHSLSHSLCVAGVRGRRAWQAWHNVHYQGVGCTPWRPLGLRRFCVAGVAQCEQPRGRMYALASLGAPPLLRGRRGTMCTAKGSDVRSGVPWGSAAFAWQAWDNVHCQGVGCTPWRPLGLRRFCVAGVGQGALPRGQMYDLASLGAPPLLRGRRGAICTAKGSDVRPGVPWGSASFAWCTPWRPLGLRLFCVAGVGQCALSRGLMYALASRGAPPLLRGRRGTMCTAKGSDVRSGVPWGSAAFAWQAYSNVHCQGVGCTPWLPLGLRRFCAAGVGQGALPRGLMYALASLGAPPLLRGRRGTMCAAKESDVRPPWRPLGLRVFCVAGVGHMCTMCTAKGSDVRSGVPWGSAAFAWQAYINVHCQGVRCTPWRPLGLRRFCVAGVGQGALRVRCTPWRPLGLRRFCVAGVRQCALPKGLMYALASLGAPPLLLGRRGTTCIAKGSDVRPGVPWGSAAFAWQAWDNTCTYSLTH